MTSNKLTFCFLLTTLGSSRFILHNLVAYRRVKSITIFTLLPSHRSPPMTITNFLLNILFLHSSSCGASNYFHTFLNATLEHLLEALREWSTFLGRIAKILTIIFRIRERVIVAMCCCGCVLHFIESVGNTWWEIWYWFIINYLLVGSKEHHRKWALLSCWWYFLLCCLNIFLPELNRGHLSQKVALSPQ